MDWTKEPEPLSEDDLRAIAHDFEATQKVTSELPVLPEFPPEKKESLSLPMEEDIDDLTLLENRFDKRVTEEDIEQEQAQEEQKSDSSQLLKKNDIELKTELTDPEIVSISKIRFMAEEYDIPILIDFTNQIMELKVSRYRRGRKEFIQGLHADERRSQPEGGILSRIFNRGGQS